MNEETKKRAIKLLQEYNDGEQAYNEFKFDGSDALLKKFEESFGGPIHASSEDTAFFKSTISDSNSSFLKMYFVCMHIEDIGRDEMEKLCVFIRELELALLHIDYKHIEICTEICDGNAEVLMLEIYYHRPDWVSDGNRNPIDEWEEMNHFCFKHCTECTDCPLKKNKKEGEPCEFSAMVTKVFALHDKMFPILTCDSCGKERQLFKVNSDGKELNVCDSCYGLYAPDEEGN